MSKKSKSEKDLAALEKWLRKQQKDPTWMRVSDNYKHRCTPLLLGYGATDLENYYREREFDEQRQKWVRIRKLG